MFFANSVMGHGRPHTEDEDETGISVPGNGVPSLLGGTPPGQYEDGDISEGGVPGLLGGTPPGAFLGAIWGPDVEDGDDEEEQEQSAAQEFFSSLEEGQDFSEETVLLEDQEYETEVEFNPAEYDAWPQELVISGDGNVETGNWHVLTGDEKTTHEAVQEDGGAVSIGPEAEVSLNGDYLDAEATWASAFFDTTEAVVQGFEDFDLAKGQFEDGTEEEAKASFSSVFEESDFSMADGAQDYYEAILLDNDYYIMASTTGEDGFGAEDGEYNVVEHGTENTNPGTDWENVLETMDAEDWEEIEIVGVGYTDFGGGEADG